MKVYKDEETGHKEFLDGDIYQKHPNNISEVWNDEMQRRYEHGLTEEGNLRLCSVYHDGVQVMNFPEVLEEHYTMVRGNRNARRQNDLGNSTKGRKL